MTYSFAQASDNCAVGTVILISEGWPSGAFFPIGTTAITMSANDTAGNTAACSFNVTVKDSQLPMISKYYCRINASFDSIFIAWPPWQI